MSINCWFCETLHTLDVSMLMTLLVTDYVCMSIKRQRKTLFLNNSDVKHTAQTAHLADIRAQM